MKKPFQDFNDPITARIDKLAEERGYKSPNALRIKTGIDDSGWSKMRSGERRYQLQHLESIAATLEVNIDLLLSDRPPIPIVGEVSALEEFTYRQNVFPSDILGFAPNIWWEDKETSAKVYCLKVKDRSMGAQYPLGSILYVLRDRSEKIKNEDLVVYLGHDRKATIRQAIFRPDELILKGLNPAVPDEHVASTDIRLCEKILHVSLP